MSQISQANEEEELLDYEEEEEHAQQPPAKTDGGQNMPQDGEGEEAIGQRKKASHFDDFLLRSELVNACIDCGFERPSEVQQECIPQAILGLHIICQARSGMGKTAVFVLAVLQQIEVNENPASPSCIVLCHTRELAYQVRNDFKRFGAALTSLRVQNIFGGISVDSQKEMIQKEPAHIIVGTPGRMRLLANENHIDLSKVKHFVLDECDKMLGETDMRGDVQDIFVKTPKKKQVMMFSATLPESIRPVCRRFMVDPMEIYVDDETKLTLHGLVQHYVQTDEQQKTRRLTSLLDNLVYNQIVIFVRAVDRAEKLNSTLHAAGFPSIVIHGGHEMTQADRLNKYETFKKGTKRILVSTDLFGRGIDVEMVNIVINYDMPPDADTYLHRVGRAGRFGTKGLSITFISSQLDSEVLNQVQERFEVNVAEMPSSISSDLYMNEKAKAKAQELPSNADATNMP